MKRTWASIFGLVLLLALGGSYFYFFKTPSAATQTSSVVENSSTPSGRQVLAGSKEYRSGLYHFSLLYPEELSGKIFNLGNLSQTITFQNVDKAQGFQMFIVPYNKAQISDERFKKDMPSGVRENLKSITLAGASGAAFYSKDAALGETYEVWFIKNDFLYEITTPKSLEGWLQNILQTWEFI